jgi:hypothetical protein
MVLLSYNGGTTKSVILIGTLTAFSIFLLLCERVTWGSDVSHQGLKRLTHSRVCSLYRYLRVSVCGEARKTVASRSDVEIQLVPLHIKYRTIVGSGPTLLAFSRHFAKDKRIGIRNAWIRHTSDAGSLIRSVFDWFELPLATVLARYQVRVTQLSSWVHELHWRIPKG